MFGLKLAAAMIAGALSLALAHKQGWVDGAQVMRGNNIIIGLALAAFCNLMPKRMNGSPRSVSHATLAQSLGRVGGWCMTLAFLAWTALWAFAPQEVARMGSVAAVGAGVTVMIGYAVWKCATWRAPRSD
ncbi:hypothetical protein EZM97_33360 [Dyella soli]|uniref:Ammonium transporter n=1 Tax=Dyella soli TaxID=522319 RepID=A0A4R0YEC2_9GAMM|nr:hypothetical protein [Dyella soli]TCI06377.1 hypothetical protein EZM97_33360 [Dyella soli]